VASGGQRPAGRPTARPEPRIVVVLERAAWQGTECRVEEPGRVQRMWGLLSAADEELREVAAPPEALVRIRRLFGAVRAELERSVSGDLATELHRLAQSGPGEPDAGELRIECAILLGWVSGVVLEMLAQLEAVRSATAGPGQPGEPAAGLAAASHGTPRCAGTRAGGKRHGTEAAHVVQRPG
jgi:Bacterial proteasome activator